MVNFTKRLIKLSMHNNLVKIDKIDKQLLEELQKDCVQSMRILASKTKLPISTIHNRIKKYKSTGLIKEFRAIVDDIKLGTYVSAIILVDTKKTDEESQDTEKIADKIAHMDYVQECYILQGTFDLSIKIRAPTLNDIYSAAKEISMIKGVSDVDTFVILNTRKETTQVEFQR